MNHSEQPHQGPAAGDNEELVNGIPHRMFDGYDGGKPPSPENIAQLLTHAPPEILARIAEFAKQKRPLDDTAPDEGKPTP